MRQIIKAAKTKTYPDVSRQRRYQLKNYDLELCIQCGSNKLETLNHCKKCNVEKKRRAREYMRKRRLASAKEKNTP